MSAGTGRESLSEIADRLYASRFDRLPDEEPWRSRWLLVETLHAAALRAGQTDHHALYLAAKLADQRLEIECTYSAERVRRAVRETLR